MQLGNTGAAELQSSDSQITTRRGFYCRCFNDASAVKPRLSFRCFSWALLSENLSVFCAAFTLAHLALCAATIFLPAAAESVSRWLFDTETSSFSLTRATLFSAFVAKRLGYRGSLDAD